MKHVLVGLLVALSLSACMLGGPLIVLPPAAEFGKPPTNYQEKIRAYVARHLPHGEGAKIDFYHTPDPMWVELGFVFHGVKNWHGYRAVFSVLTRGSSEAQGDVCGFPR